MFGAHGRRGVLQEPARLAKLPNGRDVYREEEHRKRKEYDTQVTRPTVQYLAYGQKHVRRASQQHQGKALTGLNSHPARYCELSRDWGDPPVDLPTDELLFVLVQPNQRTRALGTNLGFDHFARIKEATDPGTHRREEKADGYVGRPFFLHFSEDEGGNQETDPREKDNEDGKVKQEVCPQRPADPVIGDPLSDTRDFGPASRVFGISISHRDHPMSKESCSRGTDPTVRLR